MNIQRRTLLSLAVTTALSSSALLAANREIATTTPEKTPEQTASQTHETASESSTRCTDDTPMQRCIARDAQPALAADALRERFASMPGLTIAETATPGAVYVVDRGLVDGSGGDAVTFFANGMPLAPSWIGDAVQYELPPVESIVATRLVRGSAALTYGAQAGAVIDLSRATPEIDGDFTATSRLIGASHDTQSGFHTAQGGIGAFGVRVELGQRSSDGFRFNADSDIDDASIALNFRESEGALWHLDLRRTDIDAGEPGRLPIGIATEQPDLVPTPYNRFALTLRSAALSHERQFANDGVLTATLWHGDGDRDTRRVNAVFLPGQLPANLRSNFDHVGYRSSGLDVRYRHRFSDTMNATFGATAYREDSPRWQRSNAMLDAEMGNVLRFSQERGTESAALFAAGEWTHGRWQVMPVLRLDAITLDIEDRVVSVNAQRDPIDRRFRNLVPVAGATIRYAMRDELAAYADLSHSQRPLRYDDVGNPLAHFKDGDGPDPSLLDSVTVGLRATPRDGVVVDASLFHTTVNDRLETLTFSDQTVLRSNTSEARHRGAELAARYDVSFGPRLGDWHVFAAFTWLDAEITDSAMPELVGHRPAFAPQQVGKAGLIWHGFAQRLHLGLTGTHVGSQFWRDSHLPSGAAVSFVPAVMPAYTVFDLSGKWALNDHVRLIGGIHNLGDETYTARVRSDGLEPAAPRQGYFGVQIDL